MDGALVVETVVEHLVVVDEVVVGVVGVLVKVVLVWGKGVFRLNFK